MSEELLGGTFGFSLGTSFTVKALSTIIENADWWGCAWVLEEGLG